MPRLGEPFRLGDRSGRGSRVVVDVGRKAQHSPDSQRIREGQHQVVAQQSAIPVTDLGPRIGKENPNLVERAWCQPLREHLRIALHHANIRQFVRPYSVEDVRDTSRVNVDRHQIHVAMLRRERHRQVTATASDLQHHGTPVTEHGAEVDSIADLVDSIAIDETFVHRTDLGTQSATTGTKGAHQLVLGVSSKHGVTVTGNSFAANLRVRRTVMSIQLQVVLADYAVTHDGKIMMAGAGWSQVGSGTFASALAFLAKVPWDMTGRDITIRAELVDEDGRAVMIASNPVALQIGFRVERPAGLRPGSDIDQNLAVQIPQLVLAPGRAYEWRISVDGEHKQEWNRGFYVRAPGG